MLSLGLGEILLLAGIALVVVGPERLPRLMRSLGRQYGQLRRAADDLRRAFVLEADRQDASERYQQMQERRKAALEARRKAREESEQAETPQPVAQDDEVEAAPDEDDDGPDDEIAPNDIPPDAPHPKLLQQGREERSA